MDIIAQKNQCLVMRRPLFLSIILLSFILLSGCATSGKPQYNVEKYLLSYPASSWNQFNQLPAIIKLNRFSIAAAYNSTGMVFRDDAYGLDSFNYSRWAVNPADMVADGLAADLRQSGLFQAVFSRYDAEEGQFALSGGIEEFYLLIEKNNKAALVGISIAVQDLREKEIGKRMLFQKKYSQKEPLSNSSPEGYCAAASRAMEVISREIINDIYAVVKNRVQARENNP